MLKLYEIEGLGSYGGGIVLAAANNAREAVELGNKKSTSNWNVEFEEKDAEEMKELKYIGEDKQPHVVLYFETGE